MARPLYLQNGGARLIDLDASRRLRIECKGQADKYIPLHHVSRIVCSSTLEINCRVLIACMQSGIPLAVIDKRGQTLGWCMGSRRKESSLKQLLLHALDDPNWAELYSHWVSLQKIVIATHNLVLCGVPTTASARHDPRAALCNAHFQKHQQPCAKFLDISAEMAKQELGARLLQEVGAPELLAWYRPGLNLINDLGQLVGLYAHTDLHHCGRLPAEEQINTWAIRQHEKHAAYWQQRIAQMMLAFEQFLREHWQ